MMRHRPITAAAIPSGSAEARAESTRRQSRRASGAAVCSARAVRFASTLAYSTRSMPDRAPRCG